MAETLGTKGGELNLLIRQGATLGPFNTTVLEQDGTPIDLTGGEVRAEIRKTAFSPPLAYVTFTFTLTDPSNGVFTWELADTVTEQIPCDEDSETAADSTYVWDLEVETAGGKVYPVFYGVVNVFREVTKTEP